MPRMQAASRKGRKNGRPYRGVPKVRRGKSACPRDVTPEEHRSVINSAPDGAVLLGTKRFRYWRDYTFELTRPCPEHGIKQGDKLILSAVCKYERFHP